MDWVLLLFFFLVLPTSSEITGLRSKALQKGDSYPPMTQRFRVYGQKFCVRTEAVLLHLARRNISAENVNIFMSNQPVWYKEKHPKGDIPVLQDNDKVINSNFLDICQYVDDATFGGMSLKSSSVLPVVAADRSKEIQSTFDLRTKIHSLYMTMFNTMKKGNSSAEEKILTGRVASEIEKETLPFLRESDFLSGTTPGYKDYVIFPYFERLDVLRRISDQYVSSWIPHSETVKWFSQMSSLREVREIQQPFESHVLYFQSVYSGAPDFDAGGWI